jgi:plasmid stabilization system protein ParE
VKIVWTKPARQDLREIFAYIAEEKPRAARALLAEIKERVTVLNQRCSIFSIRIEEYYCYCSLCCSVIVFGVHSSLIIV